MRFGEPLYLYLTLLIPLLIGFIVWAEKKRKTLSTQFVDASLLSRLTSPGAVKQRRTKLKFLVWGLLFFVDRSGSAALGISMGRPETEGRRYRCGTRRVQ